VKTELKNMNSFRFIERGIKAEIERQRAILDDGGQVVQETLHFDPGSGAISSLRSKEEAHDYRYFPEPDLLPVAIDEQMLADARAAMSELPAEHAERLQREFALTEESARLLAFRSELGDFFEAALLEQADVPAQMLANWVTVELHARLDDAQDPTDWRVTPRALAELVAMVSAKQVSVGAARQVLDKLIAEGGEPAAVVAAEGLAAIGGGDELAEIVAAALAANADAAERVRGGNEKAIGPIIGAVMRETKGRADGGEVTRLVHEQLGR
jgi:aspartyl-tRNA(Asn)/glutamyl-tRNA(Gln) amidotransferase subunit B